MPTTSTHRVTTIVHAVDMRKLSVFLDIMKLQTQAGKKKESTMTNSNMLTIRARENINRRSSKILK